MARKISLKRKKFRWVGTISPERKRFSRRPAEFKPHSQYRNAKKTELNPHGAGPFCRFTLSDLPQASGVYAVTVNKRVKYIGKAGNLAQRWGPSGYASISPRNCYVGGQSTNCKDRYRCCLPGNS